MKKIISLILSVTMLASAAQLYASADIAPEVVQTEAVQETTAQSTAQETTETVQSADSESNTDIAASGSASAYTSAESSLSAESAKIKTAVSTLLKSETADEEQSGKLTTVNSPMLTTVSDSSLTGPVDLGTTFYAKICFGDLELCEDSGTLATHYDGNGTKFYSMNTVLRENPASDDVSRYWKFEKIGDTGALYTITNVYSDLLLDVGGGQDVYSNVWTYTANDTSAQKWNIYMTETGSYVFSPILTTTRAMEVLNSSTILNDYISGSANQQFSLKMIPAIAEQESGITPVTNNNIKFQLFNYDININRTNGEEAADGVDNWRPISDYFSFVDGNVSSNTYVQGSPYPETWFNDRGYYDADAFAQNHATVEPKLTNNYPVLSLANKKDAGGQTPELAKPEYQSQRSLGYLFGGEPDNLAVESYSPQNTILQTEEYKGVTHYYYNSTKGISGAATSDKANAIDYDYINNEFRIRNYTESNSGNSGWGSIFPFNTTYGLDSKVIEGSQVDYWFGMRMDVDFIQNANGQMTCTDGTEDMIFNFTGDDDVWVFIDDVLVLDIGGRHTAVNGSINFATGEIKTELTADPTHSYSTNLYTQFQNAGATPNGGWKKNSNGEYIFADYTSHKMSFFYLERAKGVATCCIDFNMPTPPENSLAVTKQVKDKNGNDVTDDDNTYKFQLCYSDGALIEDDDLLAYVKSDGTSGKLTDGNFNLKRGEQIRFTNVGGERIIKEIENPVYVKSTEVNAEGTKTVFENASGAEPQASVTLSSKDEKTVIFTNTLQSVDINFKFYNRDSSTGKTADVSSTPQTFTRTVANKEYGTLFIESPKEEEYQTYFSKMISKVGIDFSQNYENVLDDYVLFQSQAQAVGTSGIQQEWNYHTNSNYSSQIYHTDCHGYTQSDSKYSATKDEKWVTYKDSNGKVIEESDLNADNNHTVATIDVWLFNTPRKYKINVYGATESIHLNQIGEKYVANGNNHQEFDDVFYNQRFGTAIDNGGYIDSATDYLEAYGISGYIGKSVSTVSSIKVTEENNQKDLKFSYWSFDKNGKTVASTDRRYNFRIKNNLTLYAVYETTPLSEKGTKGLSVSMNDPDLYVENGKERIRLNTEINPYNCPDQDTNIQNVAAIYVVDKYANIVMDDTVLSGIKKIIEKNIEKIRQTENGISYTGIDLSTLTGDDAIKDCDGHTLSLSKGNYYVYYVDAFVKPVDGIDNQVVLTNKNRTEFLIDFAKDTLKNRRLFTFGAMLYGENIDSASWIVSDNCVDYAFDENGEAYDPANTAVVTDLAKRFEDIKRLVFNPEYYRSKYSSLAGKNDDELYEYFINTGIENGDQAHPCFDVKYYLANNEELKSAYGKNNYIAAFNHYVSCELYDNKTVKTAEPANLGDYFTANITSVAFEKYLAPDNGEVKAVDKASDSNVQKWSFARQSDGSYIIVNAETGYYLNSNPDGASNPNSAYGKAVTAVDKTDTVYKRWYIYEYGYGEYIIKSASSNILVIDVDSTSKEKVHTWENNYNPQQRFRFENKKGLELAEDFDVNADYTIQVGGKYLTWGTTDSSGTYLVLSDTDPGAKWRFVKRTSGDTTYYNLDCSNKTVENPETRNDRYMDLHEGAAQAGQMIHLWSVDDGSTNRWQILRNDIGQYYIRFLKDLQPVENFAFEAGGESGNDSIEVYLNTFDPINQYQQITITKISTEG